MVDSYERQYRYKNGLGHVGSYQVSGHPFITGSLTVADNVQEKISFPAVAKTVTVINSADVALYVYFTDATAHGGASGEPHAALEGLHYITLDNKKDAITFDVKCKEIYVGNKSGQVGAYQVVAELTNIHTNEMHPLSGSGITDVDSTNNLNQSALPDS